MEPLTDMIWKGYCRQCGLHWLQSVNDSDPTRRKLGKQISLACFSAAFPFPMDASNSLNLTINPRTGEPSADATTVVVGPGSMARGMCTPGSSLVRWGSWAG